MKELLVLFIICNIANVVIQTIKSLATIKGTPAVAAAVNAIAYGFYTYIIIITNCELPVLQKCIIVALCNLIGVYVVKKVEDKARKDKLWKVEMTVPTDKKDMIDKYLTECNVPHSYIEGIGRYTIFNCYCSTQKQSKGVKNLLENVGGKYFVSESKTL